MKKIVTIALILVLIGVSMVVIGFFNGAVTYFNSDDFHYKLRDVQNMGRWTEGDSIDSMEENLIFSSAIRAIDLDLEEYAVDVIAVDGGDLTLTYRTFSKDLGKVVQGLKVREEAGVLYLEEFNESKRTFADLENQCVTIQVPKDQLEAINIQANRNIHLEGFALKDMDIESEYGTIMVKACQWEQGSLSAELGRISVVDSDVKQTSISTKVGEILVGNCVLESSSLETEVGSIKGDLRFVKALDLTLDMGSADLRFNQPRSEVEIRGMDGSVSGIDIEGESVQDVNEHVSNILTIKKDLGRVDFSFQ